MSDTMMPPPPPTPVGGLMDPAGVGMNAGPGGLLRTVSPMALSAQEALDAAERAREKTESRMEPALDALASYIRRQFEMMKNHRNGADGWTDRLMAALRMFNGEYEADKLTAIREYGGSEIYARLVAVKCRAASAMLRDIYNNGPERPWGIAPTPVPTLPDEIAGTVDKLVEAEAVNAALGAAQGLVDPATGQPVAPPTEEDIAARKVMLDTQAQQGILKKARDESEEARKHLDDMLVEGGFYKALAEFLTDLPLFPFACIRGPIVYMTNTITWEKGAAGEPAKLVKKPVARMFWKRVSPFDIWWTPGASSPEAADFIFRDRKSRAELNAMLGIPGYRQDQIRAALEMYRRGYTESPDTADTTRASAESREDPNTNESGMFDVLEYHGSIRGDLLRDWGMTKKEVPDEVVDYSVQLWMIGQFVIKVQLSPSPRERPPFFITSYDKVPGTMVGNSVPDMLSDIQDVCNASLRALVNNMAMSSGPQVAINEGLLGSSENVDRIWPWRIWRFAPRPGVTPGDPVKFFQPASNVQQLLMTYEKMTMIADEISAIPRYTTGSERMGGAGRTASGLSMLMGNATKMLQTVAGNVDADVFEPMLQYLYDIVMLTDTTGKLRGDERIEVKGVSVAMQRETERQRQIELLQGTANPTDLSIMGLRGRGALLRAVTSGVGMDGQEIIPSDEVLSQRDKAAIAAAMQQSVPPVPSSIPPEQAAQTQGSQAGGENTGPSAIQGPRVNLQQEAPQQ